LNDLLEKKRKAIHPLKCLQHGRRPAGGRRDTDRAMKRKSIEVGHFEAWLTHGKGTFHFENLSWLRRLLNRLSRLAGLYGRGNRNILDIQVRNEAFAFENLPPAFDGFKILHMSDLHIDGLPGLTEAIKSRIQDLEYDLCLLTGDFRFEIYGPSHNVDHLMEDLLQAVHAPSGILGILGNHDFFETVPILESKGVKMLVNDATAIERDGQHIWFAGLDDPHYYGCDDLEAALAGVPDQAFKVLAVHTPELFREASRAGIDLYLCGHTHGGQICLPWIGPVLLNAHCPRRLTRGSWRQGRMQGYTSTGTGSSMVPVRFNCPPEITLIELRKLRQAYETP
jgi:predicted MPP superfamily phosphohydrolase